MNVLVTGGAGFIGSNLCERLLAEKHRVVCIDNFDNYYSPEIKRKNISGFSNGFVFYEADIRDTAALAGIFEKEKIKRGKFQYHRLSKSNLEPAKKSIENAKIFLNAIEKVLGNKKVI